MSPADALRAERDELLEALKDITGWYVKLRQLVGWSDDVEEIYRARQAIAKAEPHSIQVGNDPPAGA